MMCDGLCMLTADFLKLNLFVSWATFAFQAICKAEKKTFA